MFKRVFVALSAVCLIACLASCGSDEGKQDGEVIGSGTASRADISYADSSSANGMTYNSGLVIEGDWEIVTD